MFSTVFGGQTVASASNMRRAFFVSAALLLLSATRASAVTVDQIVSLSKAGVSEAVILALLERDNNVLSIEPEQIVALKRDGLSDTLITAMLKSGREEGDAAAAAVSSWNAASILAGMSTAPEVVIVGHGPDRPNTAHTEDWYSGFRDGVRVPSGYRFGSSYVAPRGLSSRRSYRNGLDATSFGVPRTGVAGDRLMCLAQVNTSAGPGPSYITECPAVMQRLGKSKTR